MGPVRAIPGPYRHDEDCTCDGRCTGARGPNCDCHCGGENHGKGMVVAAELGVGGRVTFGPPADADAARARAAEYLEATRAIREAAASAPRGSMRHFWCEAYLRETDAKRTHAARIRHAAKRTAQVERTARA